MSDRNKYQIQSEERRQNILNTAKRLFLRRDMTTVSMSDIARECGISRQTLYKYFDGIDAIIFEIETRIMYRFTLLHAHGISDLIDQFFDFYRQYPDDFLFVCLFDLYVHTHPIDPRLMEQYRRTIHQYLPDLTRGLPESDGAAVDGIPLRKYYIVAAHTAWGLMSRMAILQQDYAGGYEISETESRQILKKMLRNLFPGKYPDQKERNP